MSKKIVVAITGSKSSYKMIDLVRELSKKNEVKVVISKHALQYINAQIFEYFNIEYFLDENSIAKSLELTNWCDTFVITPASSNTITKISLGISDSLIQNIAITLNKNVTKIIVPETSIKIFKTKNFNKYIENLKDENWNIINPDIYNEDILEIPSIVTLVDLIPTFTNNVKNKTILITAGATIEPIDAFRYITNPAKGGSSYLLALKMLEAGYHVHIIKGKNSLNNFDFLNKNTRCSIETVISTQNLLEAVIKKIDTIDWYISPMAVGDIHVKNQKIGKIKNKDLNVIQIGLNPDVLKYVIEHKKNQKIIGFAAESDLTIDIIKEKIERKPVDLLVANIANNGYTGGKQMGFNKKEGVYWLIKNNDYNNPQKYDSLNKEELVDIISRFIIFTDLKS